MHTCVMHESLSLSLSLSHTFANEPSSRGITSYNKIHYFTRRRQLEITIRSSNNR